MVFTAILVVAFQNCSLPAFTDSASSVQAQQSGDSSGQPYDGKIYVEAGLCPKDSTNIRSRIVLDTKTTGHVVREDCENIEPRRITSAEFTVEPVLSSQLTYRRPDGQSVIYLAERPAILIAPMSSWYYQLAGVVGPRTEKVTNVDMFSHTAASIQNLKSSGSVVLCNFSAGTVETGRPDASSFVAADRGNTADVASEQWLDTRSANVRQIMLSRLDRARSIGCDGIDFDRVDAHSNNSGFPLTRATQTEYNQFLAFAARDRKLLAGLKNAGDLVNNLVDSFDLAIVEQCHQYNECGQYQPFAQKGKAILAIEYTGRSTNQCSSSSSSGISLIFDTAALNGSNYQTCL